MLFGHLIKINIMKSLLLLLLIPFSFNAQHTFSIVAIDTLTGEVGGAGATCYETVNDIADVHPGVGFIHTQSYVNYQNQAFASNMMDLGFSPQEIMDTLALVSVDADNAPTYRQYAAVDLVNGGRSAAFTGNDCFDYKGQRLGATYAIAGNILLGPEILDSMEARFVNTSGSLSEKLMAALQGAKVIGADQRCTDSLVSSLSAYLIVAKPTDIGPNYYINLNVENVMPMDPIDVLQSEFNALGIQETMPELELKVYPNPTQNNTVIFETLGQNISDIQLWNTLGQSIDTAINPSSKVELNGLKAGVYIYQASAKKQTTKGKIIVL
jgi:uncharacterized Ntn-hydrolase superfamily protein